jgi:hypothetical protein
VQIFYRDGENHEVEIPIEGWQRLDCALSENGTSLLYKAHNSKPE